MRQVAVLEPTFVFRGLMSDDAVMEEHQSYADHCDAPLFIKAPGQHVSSPENLLSSQVLCVEKCH